MNPTKINQELAPMNWTRNLIPAKKILQKSGIVLSTIILFAISGGQGFAQQQSEPRKISQGELEELLKVKTRTVQHMALNPTLINAVLAQNNKTLTLDEIKKRDEKWKATSKSKEFMPLKLQLENNPAGRLLKKTVTKNSAFNEGFLTDNQGANVANFPPTSDYWQGDEEKWLASFNAGEGKIFIGPVEFDESTNSYAAQISAPVYHRGNTVGVLVMGVTISYLDAKQN
ncbi:PDC sensor domain-containing protein [Pseudomonadota bacterium]